MSEWFDEGDIDAKRRELAAESEAGSRREAVERRRKAEAMQRLHEEASRMLAEFLELAQRRRIMGREWTVMKSQRGLFGRNLRALHVIGWTVRQGSGGPLGGPFNFVLLTGRSELLELQANAGTVYFEGRVDVGKVVSLGRLARLPDDEAEASAYLDGRAREALAELRKTLEDALVAG